MTMTKTNNQASMTRRIRNGGLTALALVTAIAAMPVMANDAQARPDVRRMTCQAARNFVAAHGSVVMTTGQYTYERFVSSRQYCNFDEELDTKYVPTLDTPRCPIDYYCRPRMRLFND